MTVKASTLSSILRQQLCRPTYLSNSHCWHNHLPAELCRCTATIVDRAIYRLMLSITIITPSTLKVFIVQRNMPEMQNTAAKQKISHKRFAYKAVHTHFTDRYSMSHESNVRSHQILCIVTLQSLFHVRGGSKLGSKPKRHLLLVYISTETFMGGRLQCFLWTSIPASKLRLSLASIVEEN